MDSLGSTSSAFAAQVENTTRLKCELYKAALDGNAEALNLFQGPLHCLVTPDQNTVLQVHLAIPNYRTRIFHFYLWYTHRVPHQNLRSTNFVEQILNRSPSLLLKPNAKGEIPLLIAARFGHVGVVELLIKRAKAEHTDPEIGIEAAKQMLRMTDNKENTALHKAVRYGHSDVVRALIQEDPDLSCFVNKSCESPLYISARRGYGGLVAMILDKCESANHYGPCGRTALHAAVMAPDEWSSREILRKRSNLTKAGDENGQTPLHYAAHFGYSKIVKLLLEYDESAAYIIDKETMTPLLMAARQGRFQTMKEIINHCPGCIEIVDKRGWNFYHFAALSLPFSNIKEIFHLPYCRRLVDEEDAHGNTPLQTLAASRPRLKARIGMLEDDVGTIRKENFDSKKEEQILQLLDEARRGEVAGVAVRVMHRNTLDRKDWDKAREARSVVAALIATVTFAAAFTLPGGYKSDQSPHDQGTPILSHKSAFKAFVISDAIAMVSSLLAVSFNFHSTRPSIRAAGRSLPVSPYFLTMRFAQLGEAALVVAFVTGLYAMLQSSFALAITTCTIILCFYFGYYVFSLTIYRSRK